MSLVFCPQYVYSTVSPTRATAALADLVNVNDTSGGTGGPSQAATTTPSLSSEVLPSPNWTVTVSVIS